jgi:hypothetical protein
MSLQKKHHEIIDNNHDTHILSRITLPIYDVAPTIIGVDPNATISITPETKTRTTDRNEIIV